ncbi:hypothetical protein BHE97_03835 [Aeromicrobium sp. PE09-221]|uniref:GTPase n=1 Tax=Aeromicrobium sp. PE09-221 TaxID=1898043 RepID=UPI000B3E7F6E|nr:GTPase [Aeromicrobium sp. PE09-221]OUZ11652.1 hypothetical protein BHE97_03835 [Aeromicrobium sp. PE09-221]
MRTPLKDRLAALETAVAAAEGRLRDDQLETARDALSRASVRLRNSAEYTIVALGGATGSGKSSLFNALSGIDLAGVGVKRPTTSWTLACTWGPNDASELLDWIGVPPRHQLTRQGPLGDDTDSVFDGLVLLDMPDHDSVVDAHQLEVDRVVEFADLFVWVLDPQKYADAAIHERYLHPLSRHRETTVVVMNQIDRLSEADREIALTDLRRLLDREGLTGVPVIATSARSGLGLDQLRTEIARRTAAKDAASTRLAAEARAAAESLERAGGAASPRGLQSGDRERLVDALHGSTGAHQLAEAAGAAHLREGTAATQWPPLRLLSRGSRTSSEDADENELRPAPVEEARAELAIREAAESAMQGAAEPWRVSMVRAASGSGGTVNRIDAAVRAVDLRPSLTSGWWRIVAVAQWVLLAALVLGLGWLLLGAVGVVGAGPRLIGLPPGVWIAVLGAVGGLVVTLVARSSVRASARRREREVEQRLRDVVVQVVDEELVGRMESELAAYERFRTGLRDAIG